MTAMLPGAFAKASIETRFEDTLVSAHRVASARRTSSRRCSAAMPDRAPEVRLRLDRLTALRGGQGPHRRRRGEPLLHLPRRRPLPLCWPPEAREPLLSPYPRPRKRGIKIHNTNYMVRSCVSSLVAFGLFSLWPSFVPIAGLPSCGCCLSSFVPRRSVFHSSLRKIMHATTHHVSASRSPLGPVRLGVCEMLDTNFREFLF